jgi:hypothetical protein
MTEAQLIRLCFGQLWSMRRKNKGHKLIWLASKEKDGGCRILNPHERDGLRMR